MTHTLKLFNTGQITLPKSWRSKFDTKNFIAEETKDGLLIKPLIKEGSKKEVVYYENNEGFGVYSEKGLPVDDIIKAIKDIHGSD